MPLCAIYTDSQKLLKHKIKDTRSLVKNGHLPAIWVYKQEAWTDNKSNVYSIPENKQTFLNKVKRDLNFLYFIIHVLKDEN